MNILDTTIPEVKLLVPTLFADERGHFSRIFRDSDLLDYPIKEINCSMTKRKGTIRGLHMQSGDAAQDKIVQCLSGAIFDVAVDMRPDSPTYHQWYGTVLSGRTMLWVPKGFAHGFQTLDDNVVVQYFVSNYFSPESERGVRWSDPKINIAWPIQTVTTSEKDAQWPLL